MTQFHNAKSPVNWGSILMRTALVLFVLTAISVYLLSGALARYSTSANGSDGARVFKFGALTITEKGDFADPNRTAYIIPGVDLTKDVEITFNGSEATTTVFAELILSKNWERSDNQFAMGPVDARLLYWSVDTDWTYLTFEAYDENTTRYVFYQNLEPNEAFENVDVIDGVHKENGTIDGIIRVSPNLTAADLAALGDTTISVRAHVCQNSGFDSVEAAWDSVKPRN